jgi:hypothetical protein
MRLSRGLVNPYFALPTPFSRLPPICGLFATDFCPGLPENPINVAFLPHFPTPARSENPAEFHWLKWFSGRFSDLFRPVK